MLSRQGVTGCGGRRCQGRTLWELGPHPQKPLLSLHHLALLCEGWAVSFKLEKRTGGAFFQILFRKGVDTPHYVSFSKFLQGKAGGDRDVCLAPPCLLWLLMSRAPSRSLPRVTELSRAGSQSAEGEGELGGKCLEPCSPPLSSFTLGHPCVIGGATLRMAS